MNRKRFGNPLAWGMQQGLLGAQQKTLTPSLNAVGENRYLTRNDFFTMLGAALVIHALVIGIASLFRDDAVKNIPVRALSFKIGDSPNSAIAAPVRIAAPAPSAVLAPPPAPMAAPKATTPRTAYVPPPVAAHKKLVTPAPSPQPTALPPHTQPLVRHIPDDNQAPLAPLPSNTPASPTPAAAATPAANAPLADLPDPNLLSQPAVAANPQRFVRENTATATTTPATASAQAAESARVRYEQQISSWIQRHYPSDTRGLQGRAVVRIRVDRMGSVRYYALETSSGNAAVDNAAIDMIRRANPMPAVPEEYPAGALIDFVIPISFNMVK